MNDQSHRMSRRVAMMGGAVGAASALTLNSPFAVARQNATPVAGATPVGEGVELLFVQSFGSSRLAPGADTLTLTLEQGTGQTLYFSDRPNRIVGMIETGKFIDVFLVETADDPANAALVAQTSDSGEATHVVELLDMRYDSATGVATYTVRLLEDPDQLDMQFSGEVTQTLDAEVSYGSSQLFIDSGGLMQLVAYGE